MKRNISINRPAFAQLFSMFLLVSMTFSPISATMRNTEEAHRSGPGNGSRNDRADTQHSDSSVLTVFTNATTINIPDNPTVGSPYPSTIAVSGLVGTVTSVSVTLNSFTAPRPSNLDFLLVGPGGQNLLILSDAGANLTAAGPITFTLADSGAANVPTNPTNPANGVTYKPSDYDATDPSFPAPAPAAPYNRPITTGTANTSTFASVFNGLSGASVNGNWNLYAFDDAGGGGASSLAGGWSIDIVTAALTGTTTVVTSSANPSIRQNLVTFTATVSPAVGNVGTVTFTDGATPLCSNVAVVSSQAQCAAPANSLTEGTHQITGTYSGGGTFAGSNGSLSQEVNNQTVIVGNNFTNPGTITINDNLGGASSIPYPSKIFVSGLTGSISKVTLTLTNLNTPRTPDVDFLLVGPNGDKYVFMSDAGGVGVATAGANLTFDDAAATQLPASGALSTGTFRPTDYSLDSDTFPAPAPAGPYNTAPPNGVATMASVYGGDAPNGTWSLYADDDAGGGGASTVGSWTLTFTTSGDAPTTTVITGNPNPSTTAQPVTFTATVTASGSPVTVGNVTFRNGATILCANVALNGSGVATCNAPAFTQGTYVISADYNGSPGSFNISSGNVTQQVNSPTVVSCLNFANNGGITVSNATQVGSPYPSNIVVSALAGTISKVTLTMTIGSALTPDHNDFLLVGPGGQKFHFMGDAGGTIDVIGQTITLDDAAASPLPDATAITSGTYRPASYGADGDAFPAPAPAGPYNPAAPDGAGTFALFNGLNPNGTWQLYATEDAGDAADTVITGWSLTFTLAQLTTTTTVTSSANPAILGQPVTFTATVSAGGLGIPTQNVQFFNGVNPLGGPVVLNGSGIATFLTAALTAGPQPISAQYLGVSTMCNGGFVTSTGSLPGGQGILGTATWDGSNSTDWHDPANWSTDFVPQFGLLSIDIPAAGIVNNPVITTSDVTVSGIAIGGNRTITIGAGRTVTANGAVSLGTGQVVGPGMLSLGTSATITHGVGGQVNATLQKNFAGAGPSFEMPVGTTGQFSPLNVLVTAGSGQLTARANNGVPTTIAVNSARTLQRYWTLSGAGIMSNITFNYLDADVPGAPNNENIWNIIRVTGSVAVRYGPTLPYVHMSPATNQFTIDGLASYSDWTAGEPLAPTAANVNVSGRVLDRDGRGVGGARLSMQNQQGQLVWAKTNPFGYYRFTNVESGQTYFVSVDHKRYAFEPRTINLSDEIRDLDFVAIEPAPPVSEKGSVNKIRSP